MVKTPRTRHSKTKRSPVTIDLDPGAVSRVADKAGEDSPNQGTATQDAADVAATETAAHDTSRDESSTGSGDLSDTGNVSEAKAAENADAIAEDETTTFGRQGHSSAPEGATPGKDNDTTEPVSRREPSGRPVASRLPVFTAGIVGGIVALAVAGLLQYSGILGAPGNQDGSGAALGQVETRISDLQAEIASLKESSGTATGVEPARVDDLSNALDQVRTDVAALQKAIESGGAGDSAALEALGTRIDGIESRISDLANAAPEGPAPADVAAINERIAAVEAIAKAAGDANSTADGRLGVIEQRLDSLSAKVEAQAGQPKIALAIASAALKSAIERGVPFQSEIETLAAIAPDSPDIAELRNYAETGVSTRAEILTETDAAANAMIAAAAPPSENAGFFDRLLNSAESLVTVRPIGAVEGQGVPETVARMEVALQAGDFQQALAEYDSLPEPSQSAGAAFADKVRARMEVERLADEAIASAMKAE